MSANVDGSGATCEDSVKDLAATINEAYQRADRFLGKRWLGLIVYTLLRHPRRFSEIGACIGLVSDRTLSVRLGELEAYGIVERRVDAEAKPVRIDYALTPKGRALAPLIHEAARWADDWLTEVVSRES
jgi:DNA-binding HxlR family transcriptional regulator